MKYPKYQLDENSARQQTERPAAPHGRSWNKSHCAIKTSYTSYMLTSTQPSPDAPTPVVLIQELMTLEEGYQWILTKDAHLVSSFQCSPCPTPCNSGWIRFIYLLEADTYIESMKREITSEWPQTKFLCLLPHFLSQIHICGHTEGYPAVVGIYDRRSRAAGQRFHPHHRLE